MLEFYIIVQIPSGRYFGAATNDKKPIVPTMQRVNTVETSGIGIE